MFALTLGQPVRGQSPLLFLRVMFRSVSVASMSLVLTLVACSSGGGGRVAGSGGAAGSGPAATGGISNVGGRAQAGSATGGGISVIGGGGAGGGGNGGVGGIPAYCGDGFI